MGLKAVANALLAAGGSSSSKLAAASVLGVPAILYKGGIPLISLSSGSVAANGAISAITALPTTYPNAYCYFPANALATVSAAGFYYCTFSSSTVGTAFLNPLPATGVATIPASPTAVTDGRGAFVGDTGEEFGPTVSIPANAMGPNGVLSISTICLVNNNANAKTARVRFSGNAGTVFFSNALASLGAGGFIGEIANASAAVQTSQFFTQSGGASITSGISGTIDTTPSTALVFSLQKATATDNIVFYPPIVTLLADGA